MHRRLSLLFAPLLLTACPNDEVLPVESTGTGSETNGDGDGDPAAGDGDGEPAGDGDGDPATGDGDGEPAGDGDGDRGGDGDGEPAGDGDGEPAGDGDGEPAGDGDGEPIGDGDGEPGGDGDGEPGGDGDGEPGGDGDGEPAGDGDGEPGDDELCLGPIFVDIDAPPNGDGLTWATAFDDIQAAIDASEVCINPVLWVAEGTYGTNPMASVATISAPVSIYGGFDGSEDALDQRDVDAHFTRLGADGWQARVVTIEAEAVNHVDPIRVDGFTISNSQAGAIELDLGVGWGQLPQVTSVFLHNLDITGNSADEGGGLWATGWIGLELVNVLFEGNFASNRGAAIFHEGPAIHIHNSTITANESPGMVVYQSTYEGLSFHGYVSLHNSLVSDNVGGAFRLGGLYAFDSEFSNNTAAQGGVGHIHEGRAELTNCLVINNSAEQGGAFYQKDLPEFSGVVEATNTQFIDNTALQGGALHMSVTHATKVTLRNSEFIGNSATAGRGGALYSWLRYIEIDGTTFLGNSANAGGAIWTGGDTWEAEITNSRFIANEALQAEGGGLYIAPDSFNTEIHNTEFVENVAFGEGGGVYGRPLELVSTTFADNTAGGLGDGLAAEDGNLITMRSVVAWPDDIAAPNVFFDHACVSQPIFPYEDNGLVMLVDDPFERDDLDFDSRTEYYLTPDSACLDVGGAVDEFDWTTRTTQASQCTDSDPLDAGVHYTPLFDAGPC